MSSNIGTEGLSPDDLWPGPAARGDRGRRPGAVTPIATEIFLQLATDLSGGAVRGRDRVDWFMPDAGARRRGAAAGCSPRSRAAAASPTR